MSTDVSKPLPYVLLADDDVDDQKIFREALQESGLSLQLQTVPDGLALMDKIALEQNPPDVLFLDINMPQKDGLQCLKEIRNIEAFKELPIVIYSTSSYKPNILDSYQQGANLYYIKPTSFFELVNDMKKIFNTDWKVSTTNRNLEKFVFTNDIV